MHPGLCRRPAGGGACGAQPRPHRLRHSRLALEPTRLRAHLVDLDQSGDPAQPFGFKDGTANLKAEDPDLLDKHVWVARGDDTGAEWLTGGSYLVTRRINMQIETWDRTSLRERNQYRSRPGERRPAVGWHRVQRGRLRDEGSWRHADHRPRSHVRLAHPSTNGGVQMLRRGYNFTDGSNALGRIDAGLFFIAFVRNPDTHYIPMQTRLASQDRLQEYLQHTGSGLFAVPPGAAEGSYVGASLFEGADLRLLPVSPAPTPPACRPRSTVCELLSKAPVFRWRRPTPRPPAVAGASC